MSETVIDREQAFLLYSVFAGDVERSAHALGVRAVDVLRMAEAEGWNNKLAAILELKKSARQGDVERGLNRAMNYVQAHRMRLILERVIQKLTLFSDTEMDDYIFCETEDKLGKVTKKLATRSLCDLAAALEKAHTLSYAALQDHASDRARRDEVADSEESGGELHQQIAKSMAAVRAGSSARALLFDGQLAIAENIVEAAKKPENPYNKET